MDKEKNVQVDITCLRSNIEEKMQRFMSGVILNTLKNREIRKTF